MRSKVDARVSHGATRSWRTLGSAVLRVSSEIKVSDNNKTNWSVGGPMESRAGFTGIKVGMSPPMRSEHRAPRRRLEGIGTSPRTSALDAVQRNAGYGCTAKSRVRCGARHRSMRLPPTRRTSPDEHALSSSSRGAGSNTCTREGPEVCRVPTGRVKATVNCTEPKW